mmetsp:Transcript_19692/g.59035  ORF Transcript_19692/g.59035 Transcript_19692/m.59035 type:complete len:307 (-) Transcript_19692:1739-2659(-)
MSASTLMWGAPRSVAVGLHEERQRPRRRSWNWRASRARAYRGRSSPRTWSLDSRYRQGSMSALSRSLPEKAPPPPRPSRRGCSIAPVARIPVVWAVLRQARIPVDGGLELAVAAGGNLSAARREQRLQLFDPVPGDSAVLSQALAAARGRGRRRWPPVPDGLKEHGQGIRLVDPGVVLRVLQAVTVQPDGRAHIVASPSGDPREGVPDVDCAVDDLLQLEHDRGVLLPAAPVELPELVLRAELVGEEHRYATQEEGVEDAPPLAGQPLRLQAELRAAVHAVDLLRAVGPGQRLRPLALLALAAGLP